MSQLPNTFAELVHDALVARFEHEPVGEPSIFDWAAERAAPPTPPPSVLPAVGGVGRRVSLAERSPIAALSGHARAA